MRCVPSSHKIFITTMLDHKDETKSFTMAMLEHIRWNKIFTTNYTLAHPLNAGIPSCSAHSFKSIQARQIFIFLDSFSEHVLLKVVAALAEYSNH